MNAEVRRYRVIAGSPGDSTKRGEWYVSRTPHGHEDWEDRHEYLHADGEWRSSTFSGEPTFDKPTGYFATEDDAKAALAKARGEKS